MAGNGYYFEDIMGDKKCIRRGGGMMHGTRKGGTNYDQTLACCGGF